MSINTKMRIILKGYDTKALDLSVTQLISLAKQRKVAFSGPIPLPVERQIYTVNRSPHIDKTSREQFERKTHKRLLCVEDSGAVSGFFTALSQIVMPAGVGFGLKYAIPGSGHSSAVITKNDNVKHKKAESKKNKSDKVEK